MSTPNTAPVSDRFGLARHRPAGEWTPVFQGEPIVGTAHRPDQVTAFAAAVRRAESQGLRYGLRLLRTPRDDDDDAVTVLGHADIQPLLRARSQREWTIGVLPRALAKQVLSQYLDRDIPLAAELLSIVTIPDAAPMITLTLLAPADALPHRMPRPGLKLVR